MNERLKRALESKEPDAEELIAGMVADGWTSHFIPNHTAGFTRDGAGHYHRADGSVNGLNALRAARAAIQAEEAEQAKTAPRTVRVRIAVVVNELGAWSASGGSGCTDDTAKDFALDGMVDGQEHFHFVEADVPLPDTTTIEGQLTS